jgi:hypothetical protein
MSAPAVDLTISITNIDHRDMLKDLLVSIRENTRRITYGIVVIDNVSQDGSADMLREEFPEVTVVELTERIGYGAAHNRALDHFHGRYLLIFNEDMLVKPGALDTMVEILDREDKLGALGCRQVRADGSLIYTCSNYHTLWTEFLHCALPESLIGEKMSGRSRLKHWDHDTERDVPVIAGCCMMIPREVVEQTGLFDESIFVYTEEFDLCKRITDAGWRVRFTPHAEIVHFGGATGSKIAARAYCMMLESRIRFFKKHYGRVQAYLLRSLYFLALSFRLLGWTVVRLIPGKKKEVAASRQKTLATGLMWFFGLYYPYTGKYRFT